MKDRSFEIPYNFDTKLIDFIKEDSELYKNIDSIYFAPYWDDYKSAKYYYHVNGSINMNSLRTMDRESYTNSINYISSNFSSNKLLLLLQQNDKLMDDKLLREFYINELGVSRFCVGSLEQAKVLKSIDNNFEIIGSITLKVTSEMLNSGIYDKYFDGFVLPFKFNRDIKTVKTLPKKFKYILLVNCDCSIYCPGTHHWLAKSFEDEINVKCPHRFEYINTNKNNIRIYPWDMSLWDNYVSCYKLQGRELKTSDIIKEIILYNYNWNNFNFGDGIINEEEYNNIPNNELCKIIADYCYNKVNETDVEQIINKIEKENN